MAHHVRCEYFKGTGHTPTHTQTALLNQGGAPVLVFFFF